MVPSESDEVLANDRHRALPCRSPVQTTVGMPHRQRCRVSPIDRSQKGVVASARRRHNMDATRRAFLQAGAGGLVTLALPGCCLLRPRQLTPFCPNDPDITSATTPL